MADLQKHVTGVLHNVIATAITAGGAAVITFLVAHQAQIQALPSTTKWLVLGVVFLFVAFIIGVIIRLYRKPIQDEKAMSQTPIPQAVTQTGITIENRPHFEVNPIINIPIFQSQKQSQGEEHPRQVGEIEIEMRKFVPKPIRVNDGPLDVLAIPFRNNSDVGVTNVIAQITFENVETHQTQDVNYGFWIEAETKQAVLGVGTTNHIALVGFGEYQDNVTLDTKWTRRYVGAYCQTHPLGDGIWEVRITLVGNSFRESYPPFRIEASRKRVIRLREPNEVQLATQEPRRAGKAECIKTLSEFAEEGRVLLLQGKDMESGWPKAKDWAARAEAYIQENIDEASAAWFSLATTQPWPGLAIDRHFVDWMHTRIQRLDKLASQILDSKRTN